MLLKKNNESYSLVIPTNRSIDSIYPLFVCIAKQIQAPTALFVLYDVHCSAKDAQLYTEKILSFLPQALHTCLHVVTAATDGSFSPQKGASYLRNYGIARVQTPLVCCIDDDNSFDPTFFVSLCQERSKLARAQHHDCIVVPTELLRDTGNIRSQGYLGFNHWIGRPVKYRDKTSRDGKYSVLTSPCAISFASSNCLFGATELFRQFPFAEDMPFVYEDFCMTRTLSTSVQNSLLLLPTVYVQHMMQQKSKLQDLYIDTPFRAYQKAKNRILFVGRTSKMCQKIIFFVCGLWVHTMYLLVQVLLHAKKKDIYSLWKSILKGTLQGIQMTKTKSSLLYKV